MMIDSEPRQMRPLPLPLSGTPGEGREFRRTSPGKPGLPRPRLPRTRYLSFSLIRLLNWSEVAAGRELSAQIGRKGIQTNQSGQAGITASKASQDTVFIILAD